MKNRIENLLAHAARKAHRAGALPSGDFPDIEIEEPKIEAHGDYATNFAMVMAKTQKMAPRRIAEILTVHLDGAEELIAATAIAGPGFINFHIQPAAWAPLLKAIPAAGERYGAADIGRGRKVQVEFVSSNPTGPLHVGHGRGAAVGDAVANILSFCGYDVQREYYINDSGRQIRTLGLSVLLRYKASAGQTAAFPEDCYQGDYIQELARELRDRDGASLLDQDEETALMTCARFAAEKIIAGIRQDLEDFGVVFDQWFSEQSLYDSGRVAACIQFFRDAGQVYEKDGALWFKTSAGGDEKDRVVVRGDGRTTYFASDIAYHANKFDRGFDKVINVWGADHHGYIARVKASLSALGYEADDLEVQLVQFANLYEKGEKVSMSTRSGEFVSLRQLREDVGQDAARFFYVMRKAEQHMDFDLDLAREQSSENPVYYLQYAHARICSVQRECDEQGLAVDLGAANLQRLQQEHETALIKHLAQFGERVETAARRREPHLVVNYLRELAHQFHSWYNAHKFIVDDTELRDARLALAAAVGQVLRNGLGLLGVSAPQKM